MRLYRAAAWLAWVSACGLVACGNDDSRAMGAIGGAPTSGTSGSHSSGASNFGGASAGVSNFGGASAGVSNSGGASAGASLGGNGQGGSAGVVGGGAGGASAGGGGQVTGGAGTGGASGAGPSGMATFPSTAPFYQDVSKAAVDAESGTIMKALDAI